MPEHAQINRILNMPGVLDMSKLWIGQGSKYGKVLIMQVLHSVLNIPEYEYPRICLNRALNVSRVLNMSQYGWKCLNRTWIWRNMSEFTIIDRVLNISHTVHSARSLYNVISAITERWVYSEPCERSKIERFWKIIIAFNYFHKKTDFKSLRKFWICVGF